MLIIKKNISRIGLLIILVMMTNTLSSSCPTLTREMSEHSTENVDSQYPAYIFVYNQSSWPVTVYFNGNGVGNLQPGQYYTWTVAAGYCYHIRTYWPNGNYNYWDTCPEPNQTFQCLTSY